MICVVIQGRWALDKNGVKCNSQLTRYFSALAEFLVYWLTLTQREENDAIYTLYTPLAGSSTVGSAQFARGFFFARVVWSRQVQLLDFPRSVAASFADFTWTECCLWLRQYAPLRASSTRHISSDIQLVVAVIVLICCVCPPTASI